MQSPVMVQGSGEGSGEGSRKPCMVQSQVRFNRVPEKVPREGSGEEAARSGSTGFRRRLGEAWCGARSGSTGFLKKVPEKVWKALVQSRRRSRSEKVPEKVWQALVQSQVRLNPENVPEKIPLVQSQVRFNRVSEKVPRRFRESPGSFSAEPGLVQQGSGEGSGEGRGGFGAEPGQVQQSSGESSGKGCREGFGEGSGEGSRKPCMVQSQVRFNRVPEKVPREGSGEEAARSGSTGFRRRLGEAWCGARSGSTGFLKKVPEKVWKALVQSRRRSRSEKVPEKVWQALVQSQVRLNPENVPEKIPLVQSQVRFNRVSEKVPRRFRESPGSFSAEPGLVQQGSGEGSGEGRGGFGAEPGQVQQSSGESSGKGCREGFGEGSGEGSRKPCMVQSQVRFNRVPEKVPREGSGEEAARSGSTGFRRRFGEAWCGARSGSTGFLKKVPRKSGKLAEKVPGKFVFPPFFVFVHVHASE